MHQDLSMLPGRGPLVRACTECGTQFRTFPSVNKRTCGTACRSARTRRLAGERNSRPCVVCGTLFYDSPGAFEKEGRKACSLKCRSVWQRGKSPIPITPASVRFDRKVAKGPDCWIWTAAHGAMGHGRFYDGARVRQAHAFAWEQATGETLTDDDIICHVCDNPPCVRADDEGVYEIEGLVLPRRGHLFKGTVLDNSRDMVQKGRHVAVHLVGSANPRAKLTEDDVRAIRVAHTAGSTLVALATRYGVTPTMISDITRRKNWTHIE